MLHPVRGLLFRANRLHAACNTARKTISKYIAEYFTCSAQLKLVRGNGVITVCAITGVCRDKRGKLNGDFLHRGALMVAAAVVASLMTGCSDAAGNLGGPELAAHASVYHLKPGDKLKISVFSEPDLTGEFQVSDSGSVAFPLIGEIQAGGLSIDDFRASLAGRLREGFVRNPRVTIDFVNYRPVNVIGEVKNAGQYAYRPGLTIQDAIAMAGGYTYRANTHTFYLRRSDQSAEATLRTDGARVTILPGDNIRIPERYF